MEPAEHFPAGLEVRHRLLVYLDRLLGARIVPDAGVSLLHREGAEPTQLDALAASQSGGWARSGPIGEKRGNPSDYAIAWLTASHIAPYTLHSAGDCATRLLGNSPNEATTYTWRVATEGRKG